MKRPGENVDHPVDEEAVNREAVALNISLRQSEAWVRGLAGRIAGDPNSRDEVPRLLTDLCYDQEIQQWIRAQGARKDHFYLGSENIRRTCDRLIVLLGGGRELSLLLDWANFRIVFDDSGMRIRRIENKFPQFPPDFNKIAAFNLRLRG